MGRAVYAFMDGLYIFLLSICRVSGGFQVVIMRAWALLWDPMSVRARTFL